MVEEKKRHKMYKKGKQWVVAPLVFVSLLSSISAPGLLVYAERPTSTTTATSSSTSKTSETSSTTGRTKPNKEEPHRPRPHVAFENKALDEAVKQAEEAGLVIEKGAEQVYDDPKQTDADVNKQVETLGKKVERQKQLTQAFEEALKNAKETGVDVQKVTTNVLADEKEAQEHQKKQVQALAHLVEVMKEANAKIEQVVKEAKEAGTSVKEDGTVTVSVEEALKQAEELRVAIQAVKQENDATKTRNEEAMKKYVADKKALEEKNAQIAKENEAIRQRNKAKKEGYEKELNEFKHATNLETTIKAVTKSHEEDQYETFMNANVNQQTGEFTLTHDMNDGARAIIGEGVLRGKIHWKATLTGDGSLAIEACAVQLYDYVYTNKRPNSAFNKNIHFHIYDNGGKELFSVYHDGEKTFTKNIQKQVPYHETMTLKPGEQSPLKKIMKVDDMWIYHTHGQIDVQFKNKNVAPKVPTYEQEKPLDPTKLTPPTPEPMKEAVKKKVVVKGEAEKVQLSVMVCPVRLLNPKKPSITKKIVQGEKETDILSVKAGDEVTFKLRVQVPNPKKLTTLVIQDDLEDVLEAKKEVRVTLHDGTDITKEGNVVVDKQTEKITWSAKEPMKWREKQLFVYVKGTLQNVDLSKYVDGKGQIMIPNVAQLIIGDKSIDSNKVNITTPQEKPKVLPNTNLDLSNKNKYGLITVGTVGAIALGGTIVNVRRKGKQEQGE